MISRLLAATFLALAAWPAAGQMTSLGGPISGTIYDAPSRTIRSIVGFPGSSYLGQPIVRNLDNALIAPDGASALVIQGGQALFARGLRNGNPVIFPVSGVCAPVDAVSWASNSNSFVTYCSSARLLQRVNIVSSPTVGQSVDLSVLQGDVTGIATSADASQIVVGVRDPAQGGFYAVVDGGSLTQLSATSDPGAAIFDSTGRVLYAIDRQASQILRFSQGLYGGYESLSFAGEPSPLTDPVGVALSRDGQRLYVAGGADQLIREYDLGSRQLLVQLPLDAVPQLLSPLSGTPYVFVLSSQRSGDQPIWILDARSAPLISFIPAGDPSITAAKAELMQ